MPLLYTAFGKARVPTFQAISRVHYAISSFKFCVFDLVKFARVVKVLIARKKKKEKKSDLKINFRRKIYSQPHYHGCRLQVIYRLSQS